MTVLLQVGRCHGCPSLECAQFGDAREEKTSKNSSLCGSSFRPVSSKASQPGGRSPYERSSVTGTREDPHILMFQIPDARLMLIARASILRMSQVARIGRPRAGAIR